MKQYNTVEDFKQAMKEWLQSNPFQSSIVIDGKEVPFLFNFVISYQIDGQYLQTGASSCQDMTQRDLLELTKEQVSQLLQNVDKHLQS
jgi:hypothetical protein